MKLVTGSQTFLLVSCFTRPCKLDGDAADGDAADAQPPAECRLPDARWFILVRNGRCTVDHLELCVWRRWQDSLAHGPGLLRHGQGQLKCCLRLLKPRVA